LARAAVFELPVLELVHDATDRFLLRLALTTRHWLTSRNSAIAENHSPAGISSRPHAPSLLPDTSWRQRNRSLVYPVGDGKGADGQRVHPACWNASQATSCCTVIRNSSGTLRWVGDYCFGCWEFPFP